MRTLLQPVMGIICLAIMAVSCKKSHEDPIPSDPDNAVETKPALQTANTLNISTHIQGFYSAVPFYYQYSTKKYPLLISIPGGGQYGNGSTDLHLLLDDGVAKLINAKTFPPNFSVDGKNFSFIVLTPQLTAFPTVDEIATLLQYAYNHYRVDSSRVYLTGLSVGGQIAGDVVASYPAEIVAISPMSGESKSQASCASIAKNRIPVWDFHNNGDPLVFVQESNDFIAWINANNPAIPPRQTIFQANIHDSWTKALNPAYKENGKNVYEWMLSYSK